jgi:para-nitrobenzyl esterase
MDNNQPVVAITQGKISGKRQGGVFVFKGIPYAAPPTGPRRWLPPAPPEPWQGVREATRFGPIAPQISRGPAPFQVPGFDEPEPQSEDCLFLNIWTPGLDDRARPVMFWIHGGGFTIGSGSQPSYYGDILASREDVVVVTVNFRHGMFGFLNLNEITGGRIPATGNEGLLDQVAALHWVRDNVAAFGGDPGNITIFGESSGAMSVGCLMVMPRARGSFHKAIMESGTGAMARPLGICVDMSKRFLEVTGLKSNDIDGIRSLSVEELLEAQRTLTREAPGGITPVAPVIDGIVIPEVASEALKKGSAAGIPTLVGSNLEETKIFYLRHPESRTVDEAGMVRLLRSNVPAGDIQRLVDTYRTARAGRGEPVTPAEILSAIRSDIMGRIPATHVAEAQCRNGQAAYTYIFTWKSPAMNGILGACHALEIGFVFGAPNAGFCGSGPEVEALSRQVQDAWAAFARSGNPSCASLGDWPSYCDKRKTMMLGRDPHIEEAPYEAERQIWETITEVLPVA